MNHSTTYNMYFVAVVCPQQLDEKVQRFKHWMKEQFGCVVALKSPAHITLILPFWLENKNESEILQTLQDFKSDISELQIQLEGFSHFGKKILFVDVKKNPSLEGLKIQTEDHFFRLLGDIIKKDDRPFHPHITIATRDIRPGDFEKGWRYFSEKKFSETFCAKAISLLKLNLGKWNVIGEKYW